MAVTKSQSSKVECNKSRHLKVCTDAFTHFKAESPYSICSMLLRCEAHFCGSADPLRPSGPAISGCAELVSRTRTRRYTLLSRGRSPRAPGFAMSLHRIIQGGERHSCALHCANADLLPWVEDTAVCAADRTLHAHGNETEIEQHPAQVASMIDSRRAAWSRGPVSLQDMSEARMLRSVTASRLRLLPPSCVPKGG